MAAVLLYQMPSGRRWPGRGEETRPHVHVQHVTGEAKIWLDPRVELAHKYGLTAVRAAVAVRLAEEHQNDIRAAWKAHFEG